MGLLAKTVKLIIELNNAEVQEATGIAVRCEQLCRPYPIHSADAVLGAGPTTDVNEMTRR